MKNRITLLSIAILAGLFTMANSYAEREPLLAAKADALSESEATTAPAHPELAEWYAQDIRQDLDQRLATELNTSLK